MNLDFGVTWRPFKKPTELTAYDVFMFTDYTLVLRPDWNKEHIAGGRPPEQKKEKMLKKKT